MIAEDYDNILASATCHLKERIGQGIRKFNATSDKAAFKKGIVKTKIHVLDGADGFSGTPAVAERSDRALPASALCYDFIITEVMMMPNGLVTRGGSNGGGRDDSQPITDDSQPITDDSQPVTDESQPITDDSQPITDDSQGGGGSSDDESMDIDPVIEPMEQDPNFITIYKEYSCNSPRCVRPLLRAFLDENDRYTMSNILRIIEKKRRGLDEEVNMILDMGDGLVLDIEFSITPYLMDKKHHDYILGKSSIIIN